MSKKKLQVPRMPKATIYITGKELLRVIETHRDIENIEKKKIPLDKNVEVKVSGTIGYGHLLSILRNIVEYLEKREKYEQQERNNQ